MASFLDDVLKMWFEISAPRALLRSPARRVDLFQET